MAAVPEVLVVEDDRDFLDGPIKKAFRTNACELRPPFGGDRFCLAEAHCVSEAEEYLSNARERCSLPDVVVLDLGLPNTKPEYNKGQANVANGWKLLDQITGNYRIPVVIITTNANNLSQTVFRAVQNGAADFVGKEELCVQPREDFLHRLSEVIKKSAFGRAREEHLRRLREFRLRDERARLAMTVSDATEQIVEEADRVSELLSSRFGVNREQRQGGPIVNALAAICTAAERVGTAVWEDLDKAATVPNFTMVDVGQMLASEIAQLRFCFHRRNIDLQWSAPETGRFVVRCFGRELGDMMAELVFDALEAFPDPPNPCSDSTRYNGLACFRLEKTAHDLILNVERTGKNIPPDVLGLLNSGESAVLQNATPWEGLLYLRSVAGNTGVGLEFEGTEERTIARLRIPVVSDSKNT